MSGGFEDICHGLSDRAVDLGCRTGNMATPQVPTSNVGTAFPLVWGIWKFLHFLGCLVLVWTQICVAHSALNLLHRSRPIARWLSTLVPSL